MHIAIIGGGQLARMLALAGLPLGIKFSFVVSPDELRETTCIDGFGKIVCWQLGTSAEELYAALGQPDIITIEKESVDLKLLLELESLCLVYPPAKAVACCQNRYHEKKLLEKLAIATSPFKYGYSLQACVDELGYPLVIKSVADGYDGKQQWILRTADDIDEITAQADLAHCIVEKFIPFQSEFSIIAARGRCGTIAIYPATENVHQHAVLKHSVVPASGLGRQAEAAATDYINTIMCEIDYVGVMAMECFLYDGKVLVNELAPRVHNSGHWTQAACSTSQFENHIRAIANLDLGSTQMSGSAGMLNLLGTDVPPLKSLSSQTSLHWYNKKPIEGRKVGHINFIANTREQVLADMKSVEAML